LPWEIKWLHEKRTYWIELTGGIMGFWDDAKKAWKTFDDISGDSYFRWRCPSCGRQIYPEGRPRSRGKAEQYYKELNMLTCSCGWTFGTNPEIPYLRCVCNSLWGIKSLGEVVGVWTCDNCSRRLGVQRKDDTKVFFTCPCKRPGCNTYFNLERAELQDRERNGILTNIGCERAYEKSLAVSGLLSLQIPNYVDRLETAILPMVVEHELERQSERQLKAHLAALGYEGPSASRPGRITYRRIVITNEGTLAEELIIE